MRQCYFCSIPCLLIEHTQQQEIFVTALIKSTLFQVLVASSFLPTNFLNANKMGFIISLCYFVNAPINGLPQDEGAGQPTGNLTFSGFQMSISPPLGLHCKSNSHCGCQNCGCHPVVDVKIPTHVRFTKSNSRGLPGPPILGQTIDRCIIK